MVVGYYSPTGAIAAPLLAGNPIASPDQLFLQQPTFTAPRTSSYYLSTNQPSRTSPATTSTLYSKPSSTTATINTDWMYWILVIVIIILIIWFLWKYVLKKKKLKLKFWKK